MVKKTAKKSIKKVTILDIYKDMKSFHLEMPLYEDISLSTDKAERKVFDFLANPTKIDAYCVWCHKERVFTPVDRLYDSTYIPRWTTRHDGLITVSFTCAGDEKHKYYVYFIKTGLTLRKVGQYPCVADFQIPQALKYRKILGDKQYKELTKGIGLNAHGVGIGSFVYLRRIFEDLISEAYSLTLQEDPNFNQDEYRKAHMDEKIQMVKNHLPEFLVENKKLYGILSKGLHELSEEECLKYFQSVRIGIEQILDEKIELAERKAKAEKARHALQDVLEEVR